MAKKKTSKSKAAKAAKAAKAGSSKARIASNVYTGMAFIATVMLAVAIGFVLYRSSALFGSVGELFNLQATEQQSMHAPAPTHVAEPVEAADENQ